MTRFACAAEDPAPVIEELLAMNPSSMLLGEIHDELKERWSKSCLRRVLNTDARFARIGPDRYVLRTPGVIEFRGLHEEMQAVLNHEYAMRVSDLAAQLGAAFGVPERDVRRAAWQRPFVCADGFVRMAPEDFAPSLWSLRPDLQKPIVQVKGGFTLDQYVSEDETNSNTIEVENVVASLLRLSEETDTGLPIIATASCADDDQVGFWWDGNRAWMRLPASFVQANPLQENQVVRMHFHGNAGHIRAVSLHVLPPAVAVEQRLIHQRVTHEPLVCACLGEEMDDLVAAVRANPLPNRYNVAREVIRLAIEALLIKSRADVCATTGTNDEGEDADEHGLGSQCSQPGLGRLTIAVDGKPSVFDPYVRWQWDADGSLRLDFATPTDPVREASSVGVLIEELCFVRLKEASLFRYGRIFRPGESDLPALAHLIVRVLLEVVKINNDSLWFFGPGELAEHAWTKPSSDYPRWASSTPIRDAVRDGVALPKCFALPTWLGPFFAEPRLEERPLVKPPSAVAKPVSAVGHRPVARQKQLRQPSGEQQ